MSFNRGSRPAIEVNVMASVAMFASQFVAQPETFPVFLKFVESTTGQALSSNWTVRGLGRIADLWREEVERLMTEDLGEGVS